MEQTDELHNNAGAFRNGQGSLWLEEVQMTRKSVSGFAETGAAMAQQLDDNDLLNLFSAVGRVVSKRFLMKRPCLDRWQLVLENACEARPADRRRDICFNSLSRCTVVKKRHKRAVAGPCPVAQIGADQVASDSSHAVGARETIVSVGDRTRSSRFPWLSASDDAEDGGTERNVRSRLPAL
jgi:hypothetical protein